MGVQLGIMIFTQNQEKEILDAVDNLIRINKKVKGLQFFVATKTGANAKGDGANRSVILLKHDGCAWKQWHKVWGYLNHTRAHAICEMAKDKLSV